MKLLGPYKALSVEVLGPDGPVAYWALDLSSDLNICNYHQVQTPDFSHCGTVPLALDQALYCSVPAAV